MNAPRALVVGLSLLATAPAARASTADDLQPLVGYTVALSTRITGWQDEDGKRGQGFEGCQYGRRIFLANGKQVTCRGYRYHYAFNPAAVVLVGDNSDDLKMVVGDDVYDMRR